MLPCVLSVDTTLSTAGNTNDTFIIVTAAGGVTAGDIAGVNLDNRTTFWTSVASVAGTTIGLASNLSSASANGSRVVFVRWGPK